MLRLKTILISLFAFALAVGGCAACFHLRPQRAADLPFRTGTRTVFDSGALEKGRLVAPTMIEDWPAQGWVHYHENGSLRSVQLSQEHEFLGQSLPAETRLFFDDQDGFQNGWLGVDTDIDEVPCRGGGKISFALHADGRLRSAFLQRDTTIDGVPCRATVFEPVRFHANGQLASAELNKAVEMGGRSFAAGDVIKLDEAGQVIGD